MAMAIGRLRKNAPGRSSLVADTLAQTMPEPTDPTPPPVTPEGDAAPASDSSASTSPTATPTATPGKKRKRRLWLWITLGLLVVAPPTLWVVGTRSFVTRKTILALASSRTGADITASSVVVELDGTVILRNAVARSPHVSGDGGVLFSADRVEIQIEWGSLFDSVPRFTSVLLESPLLRVSQDTADGSLNVDCLQVNTPSGTTTLGQPPTLTITRGVLEMGEHLDGSYTSLRRMDVEGSVKRSEADAKVWLIAIKQVLPESEGAPFSIAGQIDDHGISLAMEGMTLGEWTDANVPTRLRETFRQLGLQGRVGKTTFAFANSGEVQATMELSGMSLNLPVDTQPEEDRDGNKIPLPPEQVGRQLRMQDVRGTLSYTDGFISGDFTGNLEELPYHVRMTYGGTSAIAPFTLELTCSGFELRKNPQIMRFAPGVAQRRFAQFSQPTGIVDATVTVRRSAPIDGKESPLNVTGDIVLRDGSASFERFPYLFEKMRGHWRFSEDELEIVQIQGEASSGAKCYGYGKIAPLNDDAGADIQVEITDLPIDDKLIEALGPKRKIVDALFNRERYQELLDRGLIITPAKREELLARQAALTQGASPTTPNEAGNIAELLRKPTFAFGGKARVYVEVQRAVGPQGIWADTITIGLPDAGLVPEKFPLPLMAKNLSIVKFNDAATVTNGVLTGLSGGRAIANANVDLTKIEDPDLPFVPEITLTGEGLPVDALLINAVPESISGSATSPRTILQSLGVGGTIAGAKVRLGMTPDNDVGYRVELDVKDATARPVSTRAGAVAPRVGASGLNGTVVLTQDELTLELHGGLLRLDTPNLINPVSLRASVRFAEGKDTAYEANIASDQFDLSLAVEDFIAPISDRASAKVRELRGTYFPTGSVAATVSIASPTTPTPDMDANVRIIALNPTVDFDYEGTRVGLHGSTGKVTIDVGSPGVVAFDFLQGDLVFDAASGGKVSVDGVSAMDLSPAGGTLSLTLDGALLEAPLTRHVIGKTMSRGALGWYDRLKPRGEFSAKMVLTPDPARPTGSDAAQSPKSPWLVEGSLTPKALTITTTPGDVAFSSVGGAVAFRSGGGALENISLVAGDWAINTSGTWNSMVDGSTSVRLDLSGESKALPATLLDLLPKEIGELAADLKFTTSRVVQLENASLAMILPADTSPASEGDPGAEPPSQSRFAGTFSFSGASADVGVEIVELDAAASIVYDTTDGVGTFDVRMIAERGKAQGVRFTQGRARVSGSVGGDTIVPLFSADVHGGRLAGNATISPIDGDRKSFEIDARVSDARFASILADMEASKKSADATIEAASAGAGTVTEADRDRLQAKQVTSSDVDESRGRLDAEFSLTGIIGDASSRRGRGTLIVGGERVINVPLLIPLLRISNLKFPSDERLDFASGRFFVQGETINLEEILVSSRSVAIEGVGTATMPNYDLDLRFQARTKTGIPLLTQLFDSIRNELVSGEVRGTLADPDFRLRPFSGTRRLMDSAVGRETKAPQKWLDELESQPRVPVSRPGTRDNAVSPGS